MTFPDVIGLFGVALYVGAYAGLQLGLLALSDIRYSAMNAVGGIAVIYSLIWSFNLAAFVTQVLWLTFTIIGFIRSRQLSKTSNLGQSDNGPGDDHRRREAVLMKRRP